MSTIENNNSDLSVIEYVKQDDKIMNGIMEEINDYRKQNLTTQSKIGEQAIAKQIVYHEAIKLMGDEIFDLGQENEVLKEKIGEFDQEWLTKKTEINKSLFDDNNKNLFILNRLKRQRMKIQGLKQSTLCHQ
jgi:hypothetical protein